MDAHDPAAAVAPGWRTFSGKRVVVHAPAGSYAATRASAELAEADGAVAALAELLKPVAGAEGSIEIYLTDGAGAPGDTVAAAGPGAIVRAIQPEAPGEPVAWPVTQLLLERWLGPAAAAATAVPAGLAGLAAARAGTGPSVAKAREWVQERLAAGQPVTIFVSGQDGPRPATTAFVAHLIDAHGLPALQRFLAGFDPERRDQAALAVYERPLAALEETWLASLRRQAGKREAFRELFRYLAPLIRPYWRRWLEIAAYMLLGVAFTIALPFSFKYLFDTVIPESRVRLLAFFVLALFAIFLVNSLVEVRRAYASSWVNYRILQALQEQMFERLQRLSHGFHGRAKVGDLMSRLSQDLDAIRGAMTAVLVQGVFLTVQAVFAAGAALFLDPLLGVLTLVVVPLFALSYVLLLSRVQRASKEAQARFGEVMTASQENLSAQPVIKAFGLEQRAVTAYRARLLAVFRAILRVVTLGAVFNASVGMAITAGQLLVLGVGGYLVIEESITLGTLVAFVGLLPSFFEPITALATVGQTVQKASGAMERVREVLDEPIEIAERPGATALAPLARELRLERVTFGYEPGRPVLHELELAIPAGTHVAIVGPSGSGKSTIVSLLLRFWDPDEGCVTLDGTDLRDATLDSLRGQIALVFQDTFVFDTTVRENIGIGREGASDAEIAAAARAARLDDWVESLPAGFDTVLGERGVRMSGGQRQRLALARALLRNPSILVLDEATSALDPQTEREILDTLVTMTGGRTTISITHRLSLAAQADRVVVLEAGRLVEQGSHDELVGAGGLYQQLWDEQTGRPGVPRAALDPSQLAAIPLFARSSPEELSALASLLVRERFAADTDVVREGDPGDRLYIVGRGQVRVVVGEDEAERVVNTLGEGDYFGEMALLADAPRAATVRTVEPAELYGLDRADFAALLERDPGLRAAIEATVEQRREALVAATRAAAGPA